MARIALIVIMVLVAVYIARKERVPGPVTLAWIGTFTGPIVVATFVLEGQRRWPLT